MVGTRPVVPTGSERSVSRPIPSNEGSSPEHFVYEIPSDEVTGEHDSPSASARAASVRAAAKDAVPGARTAIKVAAKIAGHRRNGEVRSLRTHPPAREFISVVTYQA